MKFSPATILAAVSVAVTLLALGAGYVLSVEHRVTAAETERADAARRIEKLESANDYEHGGQWRHR